MQFSATVLEALSDVDSAISYVSETLQGNKDHLLAVIADYKQGMRADGEKPDKTVLKELNDTLELLTTKITHVKSDEARVLFTETYGRVLESMTKSDSAKIKALEELSGSDKLLDKLAFNNISYNLMRSIHSQTVDIVDQALDEMLTNSEDSTKLN